MCSPSWTLLPPPSESSPELSYGGGGLVTKSCPTLATPITITLGGGWRRGRNNHSRKEFRGQPLSILRCSLLPLTTSPLTRFVSMEVGFNRCVWVCCCHESGSLSHMGISPEMMSTFLFRFILQGNMKSPTHCLFQPWISISLLQL